MKCRCSDNIYKTFRNTEGYNVYVKVADTFTQKAEFYIRKAGTVRPEGTVGDATANYDYVGRAAVSLNQLKVTTDMSGLLHQRLLMQKEL